MKKVVLLKTGEIFVGTLEGDAEADRFVGMSDARALMVSQTVNRSLTPSGIMLQLYSIALTGCAAQNDAYPFDSIEVETLRLDVPIMWPLDAVQYAMPLSEEALAEFADE